jgi:hypothetical protein
MSYFATILGDDFTIKYWPGSKNEIADALSQRYKEVKIESAGLSSESVNTMGVTVQHKTKRAVSLRKKRERRVDHALRVFATTGSSSRIVVPPAVLLTEAVLPRIGGLLEELVDGYLEDGWFCRLSMPKKAEVELMARVGNRAQ